MGRKLLVIAAVLLAGSLSLTGNLQARGPSEVGYTKHNLSSSGWNFDTSAPGSYNANNTDQICVFCHTPHGGSLDAPLWNRNFSDSGHDHYSSSTLSSAGANSTRAVNNASLICLSCHDGSVSVGDGLINTAGVVPSNSVGKEVITGFGVPGPRIGASTAAMAATNDLTDDHPISISYATAYSEKGADFNDPSALTADLPLFMGAAQTVECSTCHDPHVDYINNPTYKPFLAMPNAGSAMCLACHIK